MLCEGPIDGWLSNVITILRQTLIDQLAASISSSKETPSSPAEEVTLLLSNNNCCQVVLLGLQIELCKSVEDAIANRNGIPEEKVQVESLLERITSLLNLLTDALRSKEDFKSISDASTEKEKSFLDGRPKSIQPEGLSRPTSRPTSVVDRVGSAALGSEAGRSNVSGTFRKESKPEQQSISQSEEKSSTHFPSDIQRITNIIIYLSHTRDLIQQLEDQPDITSIENWFNWFVHARHSWDNEKLCTVDMVNMSFDYGFEYQGTSSRLVNSPATDRCLMGLAHALKSKQIGLCTGSSVSTL